MDLTCVYSDGVILPFNNEGSYNKKLKKLTHSDRVYLIVNKNKYYVGYTINLKNRIGGHLSTNTNNINDYDAKVYILENCGGGRELRLLEYIWIIWFSLNTECVNVLKNSRKVRSGDITSKTINTKLYHSNYVCFCDFEYIMGIDVLNKKILHDVPSEIEYFGRVL